MLKSLDFTAISFSSLTSSAFKLPSLQISPFCCANLCVQTGVLSPLGFQPRLRQNPCLYGGTPSPRPPVLRSFSCVSVCSSFLRAHGDTRELPPCTPVRTSLTFAVASQQTTVRSVGGSCASPDPSANVRPTSGPCYGFAEQSCCSSVVL